MRFGVISDIHGNLPALEAVCEAMPTVDRVLCAGDIVGYNPWPTACIDRVRELGAVTVCGNHDRAVAFDGGKQFNSMAKAGIEHARKQLGQRDIEWLRGLPTEQFVADRAIQIVHGHPDDPDRYTYPAAFEGSMVPEGGQVVILGHTHIQEYRRFDEGVVLNPGSVGQPRDGDPKAAFAVLELDENSGEVAITEHRVDYDIDRVIEALKAAGLPASIGTRLKAGK